MPRFRKVDDEKQWIGVFLVGNARRQLAAAAVASTARESLLVFVWPEVFGQNLWCVVHAVYCAILT